MVASVHRWVRRRPVVAVLVVLLVYAGVRIGVTQAFRWAEYGVFSARAAGVTDAGVGTQTRSVSWGFTFQGAELSLVTRVSPQELEEARELDTRRIFRSRGWLRAAYVRRVIDTQGAGPTVAAIARETRRLRDELGLDADEYLEMLVSAVQSIPYGTIDPDVLLPVEVVTASRGVCSEKSLLLAALMVLEGYDTCVWVFDTQDHVAVGVASDACELWDSGYSFIETTRPGFVGQVGDAYLSRGPIARPPQFVRIGGHRRYGSGDQVAFILDILRRAEIVASDDQDFSHIAGDLSDGYGRLYGVEPHEVRAASALASYITENWHDREAVFAKLTADAQRARREGSSIRWDTGRLAER